MNGRLCALLIPIALVSISADAHAQTLASRIASAGDRSVQFSYPARPGVCGDGRSYISTSPGNFYGSYSTMSSQQCQSGPVRVVLDIADRNVVAIRTFVGGPAEAGVADLGSVGAAEGADYLLGVAAETDGRVGHDAIFAALLADKVELTSKLLDIARDTDRPLETRRAALAGLLRSEPAQVEGVRSSLVQIATNENDAQAVRTEALQVLARLDRGAGIPSLVRLANANTTSWIGRESMSVLSRSGDPRAREFLRTTVQRTDLPDDALAVALQGLGREYVTGSDASLLRSIFPRLTGQRSQNGVLSALANLGGSENVDWLMGIVRNDHVAPDVRKRAVEYLTRAGATASSLVALYDPTQDVQLRDYLISAYSRISDKQATDKLIWIARNEQNQSLRRRAISALSRSSDPVVRQAMQDIVER